MKKFIALILAVVIFAGFACGCGATNVKDEIILEEVDTTQFPDAEEYDIYSWPTLGVASQIPVPTWSNRGLIIYESADCFSCQVGYTTVDDFNNYIKELQDFGFVLNYQASVGQIYYAETEDGWAVLLMYSEPTSMMSLGITQDYTKLGIRQPDAEVNESN